MSDRLRRACIPRRWEAGVLTVVGITHSGDLLCSDYGEYYRVDTISARAFLDDYVTLP